MEKGFFHPDRGYWQTTGTPSAETLAGYPDGTVEVPLRPGAGYEWDGTEWGYVAPDPATALAQWRETSFIPRAEFCINANTMGLLSDADAELASSGAWPSAFEPIIANWPLADRIRARNKWATNANIYRSDPLLSLLGTLTDPSLTTEQLDQLCGWEAE